MRYNDDELYSEAEEKEKIELEEGDVNLGNCQNQDCTASGRPGLLT